MELPLCNMLHHNDGNGSGATAVATVLDGAVIDITLTHRGTGYTSLHQLLLLVVVDLMQRQLQRLLLLLLVHRN
jgi:hypothetical protein